MPQNRHKTLADARLGIPAASGNRCRERRVHAVPSAESCCPDCGSPRTPTGEEVSEHLEYILALLIVIEHARPKLACASQGQITLASERRC